MISKPIDVDTPQAFFHEPSGTVRFWVLVKDRYVGASIGKKTLHYRYEPSRFDDDALATYHANSSEIDAAVLRHLAGGSGSPVLLHDLDVLHKRPRLIAGR
ncbi:MAG: hypothetical protein KGL43_14255 [Burkholderiales bacterium]|nr:hypothetical protein [Burkholderiales bacterium]MDE2393896.1 hypothetical protein [Burkholderiales bacterium]MDE2454751.1 hypothetical protein [Burkholderiales bacterium]